MKSASSCSWARSSSTPPPRRCSSRPSTRRRPTTSRVDTGDVLGLLSSSPARIMSTRSKQGPSALPRSGGCFQHPARGLRLVSLGGLGVLREGAFGVLNHQHDAHRAASEQPEHGRTPSPIMSIRSKQGPSALPRSGRVLPFIPSAKTPFHAGGSVSPSSRGGRASARPTTRSGRRPCPSFAYSAPSRRSCSTSSAV